MRNIAENFRDYLFWSLEQTEPKNNLEKSERPKILSWEMKRISPSKRDPFAFFTWFFADSKKPVYSPSLEHGQTAFISFFKTYPKRYIEPHSLISYRLSDNDRYLQISSYEDPERNGVEVTNEIIGFDEMLDSLVSDELSRSQIFLNNFLQDEILEVRRSNLKAFLESIAIAERIQLDSAYDLIFHHCFNKFKDAANSMLWNFLPALPLTHPNDSINKVEYTDTVKKEILKNMHTKFAINGRGVFASQKDFTDLVALFIEKRYDRKVYFSCNGREVGYILKKLKAFDMELSPAQCGKNGCILKVDKNGDFYPMKAAHISQVMKNGQPPKKTSASIEAFFTSINLSNK